MNSKKTNLSLTIKSILFSSLFLGLTACGGDSADGPGGTHQSGVSCELCHGPTGNGSGEKPFNSGGTIFNLLTAANHSADVASGMTIRLENIPANTVTAGTVIATASGARGIGNFIFYSPPTTNFIAVVKDAAGNENRSGMHTPDRKDCNSCHTATGTNGAPGRIVSPTPPVATPTPTPTPTAVSFSTDVFPLLNDALSCNQSACHASNAQIKPFVTTDDAAATFAAITNLGYVSAGSAATSKLWTKPADAAVGHAGGTILTGANATTVQDWINQGAKNN